MYFDSHAHYDDRRFNKDRDKLLSKTLKENKVSNIINIGADMRSSEESVELARKYDYIYATVGVHPHSAKDLKDKDINRLRELAQDNKVIAIGEIGLDYYRDLSPRNVQKEAFEKQLNLCSELALPVAIHERDAEQDTFAIIKNSNVRQGVIHAYSSNLERAKMYLNLGFHLGIGGVLTYKSAASLKEIVKQIPLSRILIETDAPYLTPAPHRGERNDSSLLKYVVDEIARIKELGHDEVAKQTSENAKILFNIY